MERFSLNNLEVESTKMDIFILEKQEIYRRGLIQAIVDYPDMQVVGNSDFLIDIYEQIESYPPNVVVIDIDLPSLSGLGMVCQVAKRWLGIATVVLSPDPDDEQLFQAIKSGASAFINKDATVDELVTVIRRAGRKEYPINDVLLHRPLAAQKVISLF